jgi:alpha-tubulin suppressor-like RCC1 family protein
VQEEELLLTVKAIFARGQGGNEEVGRMNDEQRMPQLDPWEYPATITA